jgi:nucleoside-diphosphate-sugar epimerase
VRKVEDVGLRARTVNGVERLVTGRDFHRPGTTTMSELVGGATTNGRRGGNDPRRVLVTGGAGFIGSHLTRMLLDAGYHVRVLERFDYGRAGLEGLEDHPRLEIMTGDICNSRDVSRAVRDVDGVLALAAIVGDPACNLDPDETINLNYTATKILVETCNFYGVRRLVFASSCSVYGASESDLLTERSRLNPVSLYARTRVLSENIIFDRRGDVEPVVLRLSTVFGLSPRMRFDLVVNTLTVRAVVDGKIAVFGGDQWRPNVHCRDVARAFVLALEAPAAAVSGEIFNVGGDQLNHRIAELGQMVASTVGNVEVDYKSDVPDPRNYRVSFEKIRRTLGFQPEYTVARGIEEVAAAVRANPALQLHQSPVFHNVQAFKQSLLTPRRRREDFAPTPSFPPVPVYSPVPAYSPVPSYGNGVTPVPVPRVAQA